MPDSSPGPVLRPDAPMITAGDHTGIVTDHAIALVVAPTSHPTVAALADVLFAGGNLPTLIGRLAGADLTSHAPFALVLSDEVTRVLVRGSVQALVTQPDGTSIVHDGSEHATWLEVAISSPATVTLLAPTTPPPAPHDWTGVGPGLGPAGILAVRLVAAPSPPDAPPQPSETAQNPERLAPAASPASSSDAPPITAHEAVADQLAPAPEASATGSGASDPELADPATSRTSPTEEPGLPEAEATPDVPVDLDAGYLFEPTTSRPTTEPPTPPPVAPGSGSTPANADHVDSDGRNQHDVDQLSPATLLPSPPTGSPAGTSGATTPVSVPPATPLPSPLDHRASSPAPFADEDGAGLITSVPGMAPSPLADAPPHAPAPGPAAPPAPPLPPPAPRIEASAPAIQAPIDPSPPSPSPTSEPPSVASAAPTPPPPPVPPTASADDDLDDATVTLAARRAATAEAGRPRVQAVLCPAGHANPTHADQCRTCGSAITDRAVHDVARPPLGRIVFDDGTQVEIDRHVVLGRRPVEDPLVAGEPHQLITVPDPDDVVSRTHLVLRVEGWQVHAIDRDSTNHTFVEIPGQPPFQLRPGDPYPIPPGSTIRLGDEVGFVYDATQR